jgi:hypothetical protein
MQVAELLTISEHLAKAARLLPRHAQSKEDIFAIVLAGDELGMPPMAALRSIQLVSGKVCLTADAMLGQMAKAGILIHWEHDGSDGVAELHLTRGRQKHVQRWTEEDRKKAGLNTDTWKKFPGAMLRARCVSAAVRAFAADVLSGAYLPGELPDDTYEEGVGDLGQLPVRKRAERLPEAGAAAVATSMAHGFVAAHPIATDPFVAVDLQTIDSDAALGEWILEAISRAGSDQAAKGVVWEAFSERCAALEKHPKELLAAAKAGR